MLLPFVVESVQAMEVKENFELKQVHGIITGTDVWDISLSNNHEVILCVEKCLKEVQVFLSFLTEQNIFKDLL